jgi:hypothetical protein
MSDQDEQPKRVPIDWHYPDGLVSRYADNLVVQHTPDAFVLSFFEVQPPLLTGSPEEKQARLQHIETVRAECVARVIVPPGQIESIIRVLQENADTYQRAARAARRKKE